MHGKIYFNIFFSRPITKASLEKNNNSINKKKKTICVPIEMKVNILEKLKKKN